MIELDVDMGYLLEDGEPDCVTLNDENGEFEPMTFYRGNADAVDFCKRVESAVKERKPLTLFGVDYEVRGECELTYGETDNGVDSWFTQCGGRFDATFEDGRMVHPKFCQFCGGKAVER